MKQSSPICIISPSLHLYNKAKTVVRELGESIDIHIATLETVLPCATELINNGAEILISRKGTQTLLERESQATVVGIRTDLSDYVEIMKEAKKVDGLVAVFSYDEIPKDIVAMSRMLGIRIKHYGFKSAADSESAVRAALGDGARLGIGGAVTEKSALSLNLPYLPLENSREAIFAAIETAKNMLTVKRRERKKRESLRLRLERYQAVVDFSHDAILSIDADGSVDVANPVAEQILGKKSRDFIGKNIREVIPSTIMPKTLATGTPQLDQLVRIGDTLVMSNCVPIPVDGKIMGAVATFQDVRTIQNSEQIIRVNLHERGLAAKYSFADIVGDSPEIALAIKMAESYAGSDATVLIHGETGTGKELFAHALHQASKRRSRPFVAINCATLEKNLLESELFGYVAGAFTGALKSGKTGLFELAHTGTLFLDEIGEIPADIQAKLLRVLSEREVRRLGGNGVVPVDVRIIAATNRDLEKEVAEKHFREDLYYRLNILELPIPPLRKRAADIPAIADGFLRHFAQTRYEECLPRFNIIMRQMQSYRWPGNIRELQNFIERISLLLTGENSNRQIHEIVRRLLEKSGADEESGAPPPAEEGWNERSAIVKALKSHHGKMGQVAEALGISRTTLWRKLKQYRLN